MSNAFSSTAIIAVSAIAALAFAIPVAASNHCDATITSGDSIQTAITSANSGDTVCVDAGTYTQDVNLNKDITLDGLNEPSSPDAAVIDGGVDVSASDATVSDLKVAPSTTFEANGLDPVGILVTGDVDGVTVEGNIVEGMSADSTGGSVTINGIQLWNDGPDTQTNTLVRDNVVRNLDNDGDASAGWPNYGGAAAIKVQGVIDGAEVTGNQVSDVHSAGWTYGIVTTHTNNAPGISPTNTSVENSRVENVNDGSRYDVFADENAAPYPGAAFAVDGDSLASEVVVNHNDLVSSPIGVQNKDAANTLDATGNHWGHASGPGGDDGRTNPAGKEVGKGTAVVGDVNFSDWLRRSITNPSM